jgi:cytoskeletal protein RodZ
MDKKAMMMIMVLLAVLSCLVSLGVSLWYYFTPSDEDNEDEEDDNEESTEEKNDSLLPDRPAFTLNVINGDNETTETVTPTGDETVDVTVDGDTATTTGATTAEQPAVLTCEEGQTESNGECVDVTPVETTTPAEQQPAVDPTVLTCAEGQMESDGKCVDVVPVDTTTPADPVTPVDSCNKTICNDWMNDLVIKNYWAFPPRMQTVHPTQNAEVVLIAHSKRHTTSNSTAQTIRGRPSRAKLTHSTL